MRTSFSNFFVILHVVHPYHLSEEKELVIAYTVNNFYRPIL